MAFSATVFLTVPLAISPAMAVQSVSAEPQLTASPAIEATVLLAQANTNSTLYFRTANYTMHVFREGGQSRMNVYNNATGILEQNRALTSQSFETYATIFASNGARNGLPITYRAVADTSNRFIVQILDSDGRMIVQENAVGDVLDNLTPDQRPTGRVNSQDILVFNTTTYAARLFRRDNETAYIMNVYNKISGQSEQNGALARLVQPSSPNERRVSYVSSGIYNNIPAQYFMRIDDRGQTVLEIVSESGQLLLQEPGVGPVIVNIPSSDIPAGVDRIEYVNTAYVVAVFGEGNTLAQVQQFYPEAFAERSGLGNFINAGAFADRNLAMSRVLELRGRGFNSRLVYRDVRYR
ncbi:MAG: hypothetical protein O3A14_20150 [Cyanobacteria bacterium]|nr:hypothetical protein [Cyanobacteriota bacterium]